MAAPLPASPPPAALFVQVCPFCCLVYSSEPAPVPCPDCPPDLVPRLAPLGPPTVVRISNPLAASIRWARAAPAEPKGSP